MRVCTKREGDDEGGGVRVQVNWNGEPRGWSKRLTVCTARRRAKSAAGGQSTPPRVGIGRNDAAVGADTVLWEEYLSHQLELTMADGVHGVSRILPHPGG
jgi:hypothetical protein